MLPLIASLFVPAVDLIKKYISKEEDQMKALTELEKIQASITTKFIELEQEKLKLQVAETQSTNWLSASWRPISSLSIIFIIILASFDIAHPNQSFYDLAQYMLVGYVGGRSMEKVSDNVAGIVSKIIKR